MACGPILTGIGCAFVDVRLAQVSTKAIHTQASEVPDAIKTGTAVEARRRDTVISIDEAIATFEAFAAFALVAAISVDTGASIPARISSSTLIDVLVTESAGEAQGTGAEVIVVVGSRGA